MRFKLYEFYVGNKFYIVDESNSSMSSWLADNIKYSFDIEFLHTPSMNITGDRIVAEANTIEELKMKVLEYII